MNAASTPSDYALRRRELAARPGRDHLGRRRERSDLTDGWLREVFAQAVVATGVRTATLVAVGGYGRHELSPGSDLDLLLLHDNGADVGSLADKIWYPVWDTGVRLDHAVRTPAQARRLAATDLAVLLGLLNARAVAGDPTLADGLRAGVLRDWRATARRRLPELRASWDERGDRAGDLRHDLEPDLKEGRGGLRDVVALRAVAASWVADLPHRDVDHALQRVADARDALHASTGRSGNRLLLQEQDQVARDLGVADADQLLRDIGEAAATICFASDVTWRRALHVASPYRRRLVGGRRSVLRLLGAGLAEHDGEAVLTDDVDLADPVLPLRFAARAARAGLPLSPSSVDRLRVRPSPMPVPWPAQARELFVDLLGAGPGLVPAWESLDRSGRLDELLPEWETVRHLPQRNPMHRFSVDRHLLEAAVQAAALVREVRRPDLLLVAALLHDIGKGARDGDHSEVGEPLTVIAATRMGFAPDDVSVLAALVRWHLLLAETATRRDLDDPTTVARVAELVGHSEVLELLVALTRADSLATGPTTWSPWKERLVAELTRRTAEVLGGQSPAPPPPLRPEQQALVAAGRLSVLAEPDAESPTWSVTVAAPDRTGLFAAIAGVLALHRLPVRSAQVRTQAGMALDVWTVLPDSDHQPRPDALRVDIARAFAGDLDLTARLASRDASRRRPVQPPPAPRVEVIPAGSATATVLEVRAADAHGLLHRLGSALAHSGADIRGARVVTLGAEAVDVFYLQDRTGVALDEATMREAVRLLTEAAN